MEIESVYHEIMEATEYTPFDGICLTDTFQLGESDGSDKLFSEMLLKNSERVEEQKKAPLQVIMGNPPYSVGQKSANDNAQNQEYKQLNRRIAETYAAATTATNKNSLYDSYIKAFRWSTDRLDPQHGGIIAFVSNGAWLDGNSADGFRKCLEKEFSAVYLFNLRGNQRTSGELSRKEGGKIFGSGSRTPVSITLLVKNPEAKQDRAVIYYHDIGDYLSREEKLKIISSFRSVGSSSMQWRIIQPNEQGDWINQRNDAFANFIPLGDKKDKQNQTTFFVPFYSNGVKSNRDAWVYNFNSKTVQNSMEVSIDIYNRNLKEYILALKCNPDLTADDFVDFSNKMISWTYETKKYLEKKVEHQFFENDIVTSLYRPFVKQNYYFNSDWNNRLYQIPKLFPDPASHNLVICVPAPGGNKELSVVLTDCIPDIHFNGDTQCFPLYWYEKNQKEQLYLFDSGNDLKKMLTRLPLLDKAKDFRALADLHINYETVPPYDGVSVTGADSGFFRVEKMRFPKKNGMVRGKKKKVNDTATIHFNSRITFSDIPEKACQYVVNGKSAVEWIMERYRVKTDKKSGITNDPDDWAEEVDNPRYILDLLLSVINVSVQTVDIVDGLPKVDFG